jgi:hypothetical protein
VATGRAPRPEPAGLTGADDETYEARFASVAVNVVRKRGSRRNDLPGLMRAWFGDSAGLPGSRTSQL